MIKFSNLHIIYFREENEFESITLFMHKIAKEFKVNLLEINGSFIEGLNKLLANYTNIKAIFMGQRHIDPNCSTMVNIETSDVKLGWLFIF